MDGRAMMSVGSARDRPAARRIGPLASPAVEARASRRHGSSSLAGLVWTLVRTDFKSRYHGTAAGFLWALLKPACMFVVLWSVFSFVFVSDDDYRVNLIIGLFLWDFFSDATHAGLLSLASKGYLVTKARVAPWVFVLTSLSNAVITLAVFAVIIVAFVAASGYEVSPGMLGLFLLYLAAYVVLVAGISMVTSVLFLEYRDLNQVWDVVIHAGFFVAPIVYPLEVIPERMHAWLYLWPPTPIVQFSRAVLVEGTAPSAVAHAALAGAAVATFAMGAMFFQRRVRRAIERL
jgi:ABC-type polysaccharide/polyol phosphate export permease